MKKNSNKKSVNQNENKNQYKDQNQNPHLDSSSSSSSLHENSVDYTYIESNGMIIERIEIPKKTQVKKMSKKIKINILAFKLKLKKNYNQIKLN
jgi:hypothetical protein